MGITSEQIHNVLRTYSRQLDMGNRLRRRGPTPSSSQGDRVTISLSAQRENAESAIPEDIVSRLSSELQGGGNRAEQSLQSLSRLYGREVHLEKNADSIKLTITENEEGKTLKEVNLKSSKEGGSNVEVVSRDSLIRDITAAGGT